MQSLCGPVPSSKFCFASYLRHLFHMQVEEKTKLACQPEGFYGPLTEREVVVSAQPGHINEKIHLECNIFKFAMHLEDFGENTPVPFCRTISDT